MTPVSWNPNGKKVIVSIDGGGMRGIIPLAILAELEAQIGAPAHQWIDFIVGTSTGAIIAAGLSLGLSAADLLRDVYKSVLPAAFPKPDLRLWLRFALGGFRYIYPTEKFEKALIPLTRGRRLADIVHPILLLTTKDVRTGSTLYMVSAGPGARAFADFPLAGAVAASSAAPIFFPSVAGNLTDGGVGVDNNPCLVAAIEAMEYLSVPYGFVDNNVILISLGTGYTPRLHADGAAGRFHAIDWIRYLISESFDDASLQQAFSTRAIYQGRIDFRRYNPELTDQAVADVLGITTAGRPPVRSFGLVTTDPAALDLMEEIGRTYARRIDWALPNVMPWDTPGGHAKPNPRDAAIDWKRTPYGGLTRG